MNTPSTRLSLLALLQSEPTNDAAWAEFVARYGTKIAEWCRQQRLTPAEVEELTQEVLIKLFQGLKSFRYEPKKGRFRAYLYTITRNAIASWRKREARGPRVLGDEVLQQASAEEDLIQRLEREFDLERFHLAMGNVQAKVQPATWLAFQGTELEGRRAVEVGRELGLPVATVNVYRSRIRALLKKEVKDVNDG